MSLEHLLHRHQRRLAIAVVVLLIAGLGATSIVGAASWAGSVGRESPTSGDDLVRDQQSRDSNEALGSGAVADADVLDVEVIAPPPESFDEPLATPAPPVPAPAPDTSDARGTGVWALVIGIDDYPGSNGDLRSAVNDTEDFELALDLFGVPTGQRRVLTDRQATSSAIIDGLDWLTEHAGPDAIAVVFYAGHVRKISSQQESIIAADGHMVSDSTVADRLARLRAERAWIVIAACYGGGFDEVLAPGRVLTAAAPANRLAYESNHFRRSYLVQYLIRQGWLEGRAGPTVQSAFHYSASELRRSYPNRLPVQFDPDGEPLSLGAFAAPAVQQASPPPQPDSPPPKSSPPPEREPSSSPPPERQPESSPPPEQEPPEKNCTLDGLLLRSCS